MIQFVSILSSQSKNFINRWVWCSFEQSGRLVPDEATFPWGKANKTKCICKGLLYPKDHINA